jgi:hypothetical protein
MTIRGVSLVAAMFAATSFAGWTAGPGSAEAAVVYCTYIGYPTGCIARPGVRLYPRPPVGAVTAPRPGNRNGGVNRIGVRR